MTGESPIVCEDDTKPAQKNNATQNKANTSGRPGNSLGPLLACEHRSTETSEELLLTIVISDWPARCVVPFDAHILCL